MTHLTGWDYNTFIERAEYSDNAGKNHDKNYQIYCDALDSRSSICVPAVGDIVVTEKGERRLTEINDSGDSIQTGNTSFLIFYNTVSRESGSLDIGLILKSKLKKLPEKEMASFWFFSENCVGAHRSIHVKMPVNVWVVD